MLSQTGLTILYIFAYAWFCVGFLLIAIPAIKELITMKSSNDKDKIDGGTE